MKLKMRHTGIVIATITALLATSCRDDLRTGNGRNDGRIAFSIDSSNDWQTRAAADSSAIETYHIQQKVMPVIVGNDTLMLTLTIEPNFGIEAPAPAETRSAPVTTATLKGFHAVAYCQDNAQLFFNEEYSWTDHTKAVETGHFWPNNRELAFCAYALQDIANTYGYTPKEDNQFLSTFSTSYDSSLKKLTGSFTYTSPCSGEQGKNWFDALVQPDPVVAIKPNQVKQETTVPLKFHHPLAAIRIKVGTVPENILVRDTYLKRIIQTGDCEFVASGTDDDITFTWSNQTETDTVTYIQSNWKQVAKSSSGTEIHKEGTSFDDCTFFVVPQTLRDDAEIGFDYHVAPERKQEESATSPADTGDNHYRIFKAFKAFGVDKLEADTRYTFTLSLAGSMGITITDACSNGVKNNVVITNTGRSTGYVRAAIVGWWKNNSNNIVAPWNDLPGETCTYGKYELPTNWNTYWKKGGDGFFYYHRTVLPGKKLEGDRALFTSYTLTGSAPVTGALLEIDIVAQIIRIDADLDAYGWIFPAWP